MACRLIAIDKCPGVRPIGVGETLRRVIGKTVCMITRSDVEEIAGVSQLCAGIKAGVEGAIHAINDLFEDHKADGWGVLLVVANNALTPSIVLLHYGMLVCYGQDVFDIYLIPIEVGLL